MMSISKKRDEIEKRLGKIQRKIFKAVENGTIWGRLDDYKAEASAVKTEWRAVRTLCTNPFHGFSKKEKKNKVCPDCGIRKFEWLLEN